MKAICGSCAKTATTVNYYHTSYPGGDSYFPVCEDCGGFLERNYAFTVTEISEEEYKVAKVMDA